jgi:tetratricopeptide (TPR) repeat protein
MKFRVVVGPNQKESGRERELQRLIKRNPDEIAAYLELSELYQDQGYFGEAEQILQRALKKPWELPEWATISNQLGWALFNQEKYDAALEVALLVIGKVSEDIFPLAEAHYLAGVCYGEKWDPNVSSVIHDEFHRACVVNLESALKMVKAEKDHDFQAYILSSLASVREVEGCHEEAMGLLQEALSLSDLELHTLRACHAQLGCLYDDYRQDNERARHHFQQAIQYGETDGGGERSNELSWIYRRLAIIQKLAGDMPAALVSADKALAKVDMSDPAIGRVREADAHRLIGDLRYEAEEFSVAVEHYKRYLRLEKENVEGRAKVQMFLGYALMGERSYRQANKYLSAALETGLISDAQGYVRAQVGYAAYHLGDFRRAVQCFTQALDHLEENEEARLWAVRTLGHAHFHLEQYAEAAMSYREALKLVTPDDPIRSELMQYLLQANERL